MWSSAAEVDFGADFVEVGSSFSSGKNSPGLNAAVAFWVYASCASKVWVEFYVKLQLVTDYHLHIEKD